MSERMGSHINLSSPGNGRCSCGARPIAGEHIPTWWRRHQADPSRHIVAAGPAAPVPAADRQTDEERCADCGGTGIRQFDSDGYEACRCLTAAARPADADEKLAGLRDKMVDGIERAQLREAVAQATIRYNTGAGGWLSGDQFADALLALPEMAALLDAADKVWRVEALLDEEPNIRPDWEFERGALRGIEMTKAAVRVALRGDA